MKVFVLLILLHSASAVIHSLKYFYTGSSGPSNLPEFVSVGVIDGVQMFHYDSSTSRAEPKQDWMEKLIAEDPDYWSEESQNLVIQQHFFKVNIESLRNHFNQSGGVHVLQRTSGCEWDDETGETDGFMKFAYDGEDFLSFDLKTKTWIPLKQEALLIKHEWDNDPARNTRLHHLLSKECPRRLQRLLSYGRSSLLRTELPSVFLLQKTPSSPITCLATGFHPNRAMLFWRRDGEELHEGVDVEETLPNHDGSFQRRAHLDPPSDDWQRYECVFSFSSVKEDVVTRLDRAAVRSNSDPVDDNSIISIIYIVLAVVAALLLLGAGVAGFLVYRKKQEEEKKKSSTSSRTLKQPAGSYSASRSSADSEAPRSADSETPRPDINVPQSEDSDPDVDGDYDSFRESDEHRLCLSSLPRPFVWLSGHEGASVLQRIQWR